MIVSKHLLKGCNFIDGEKGEYIGCACDGEDFYAIFDGRRTGALDQFNIYLVEVDYPHNAYPAEYSVECIGEMDDRFYIALIDLEN